MSDNDVGATPTPEDRAAEFAAALEAAEKRAAIAEADAASVRGTMDRRDFLAFVVGGVGGAAFGALSGWGLAHWSRGEEDLTVVMPPSGSAAPDDVLVFYPRVEVARMGDLAIGEQVSFEYPLQGQTASLVKLGKPAQYGLGPDGDIVAFSTICTHMGWPLGGAFDPEACVFGPCPGHFSTFDASVGGQVTLGQASQRLPQVVLVIEDDVIYAEGVLGLIYGYRNNLLDGDPVGATA